jgi:cysteine desulfurase family protein (TIGR01976 family)
MTHYDVAYVRSQFPALKRMIDGRPAAYLDAPGGTQTPQRVLDAVREYLAGHNANYGGRFATSEETDATIAEAHRAGADFLGCDPAEVSFGANMTTLTYLLAEALARRLQPGDEVVITALDHEANRSPWQRLAERGVVVREVPVDLPTCTLDWQAFETLVQPGRTKIVALGYASNAVGTVNDVARAAGLARAAGAWSVVDAVHYALHGPIDVRAVGCDFLLCSAYKFFGPHVGLMFARREATAQVEPLRLATQTAEPPYIWETGTLNFEGLAGTTAAIDFIADLGERHAALVEDRLLAGLKGRRRAVVAGMLAGEVYEQPLAKWLREQLAAIPGVTLYGPPEGSPRTSTVSFTLDGFLAGEAARTLGERGLFVWDGDFYAARLVELLGLAKRGGLIRVGLAPYTTQGELERLVKAIGDLSQSVP